MDEATPPIEPTDLLGHADFLRGLVRGLVQDDHHGDDVLQETWLAALQRPPRHPGALRAWLGTVARNFALKRIRSETSRTRRESAAARPEPQPSTDRVVAHQSLLRDVTDAVLSLDPPYQEVIFLRFYEQLPPREIAARLETPVETVRSRQKRALEQLRGKLAARHGPDWRHLLLPLLPVPASRPAVPCGPGAALKVTAALAGTALVGLILCYTLLGERRDPAPTEAPATTGTAATAGSPPAAPRTGVSNPPRTHSPLATDKVVQGRVVDGRGRPIADALVLGFPRQPLDPGSAKRLTFSLSGSNPDRVLLTAGRAPLFPGEVYARDLQGALRMHRNGGEPLRTRTDGAGRFSLASPWSQTWLEARHPGCRDSRPRVARSGGKTLLTLLPGAALTVQVVDDKGEAVDYGTVRLVDLSRVHMPSPFDYPTATIREKALDPAGRATFQGLAAGVDHLALFTAPGWGHSLSTPVRTDRKSPATLRITARPACALTVRVEDGKGAPLAGVRVRPTLLDHPPTAKVLLPDLCRKTDRQGRVTYPQLPPGRVYLDAYRLGRCPAERVVTLTGTRTDLALKLDPGRTLRGRVTWDDSTPAADVVVGFIAPRYQTELPTARELPHLYLDPVAVTRTGLDGTYTVNGLPDRPVDLVAISSAFSRQTHRGVVPGRADPVDFTLARGGAITGRAVDGRGAPLDRLTVHVWQLNRGGIFIFYAIKDTTTRDGRFRVEGLTPGIYRLVVHHPGLAEVRAPAVEVRPGTTAPLAADLVLEPPATLSGRVVDAAGHPLPGVPVQLVPGSQENGLGFLIHPLEATSGPEGNFTVRDVPPGWWGLKVMDDPRGWAFDNGPYRTAIGSRVEGITLRLRPLLSVGGTLHDREGRLEPGCYIQGTCLSGLATSMTWGRTDPEGHFRLGRLVPGTWWFIATSPDFLERNQRLRLQTRRTGSLMTRNLIPHCREVQVRLAGSPTPHLVLGTPRTGTARITGRVTEDGRPVGNIKVLLEAATGTPKVRSPIQTGTDPQGRFAFKRVCTGRYRITVHHPGVGSVSYRREVQIEPAGETDLAVEFGPGLVEGRLLRGAGVTHLAGVGLVVRSLDGSPYHGAVRADREGRFRLRGLPPGRYEVVTSLRLGHWTGMGKAVGRSAPFTLTMAAPVATLDLPVQGTASLTGRVTGPHPEGSQVSLAVPGWPGPIKATVGPGGRYLLPSLPPGRARVAVCRPGKKPGPSREVTLVGGRITELDLH